MEPSVAINDWLRKTDGSIHCLCLELGEWLAELPHRPEVLVTLILAMRGAQEVQNRDAPFKEFAEALSTLIKQGYRDSRFISPVVLYLQGRRLDSIRAGMWTTATLPRPTYYIEPSPRPPSATLVSAQHEAVNQWLKAADVEKAVGNDADEENRSREATPWTPPRTPDGVKKLREKAKRLHEEKIRPDQEAFLAQEKIWEPERLQELARLQERLQELERVQVQDSPVLPSTEPLLAIDEHTEETAAHPRRRRKHPRQSRISQVDQSSQLSGLQPIHRSKVTKTKASRNVKRARHHRGVKALGHSTEQSTGIAGLLRSGRRIKPNSPSGRSKYADVVLGRSPVKRPPTTPRLLDRLRAARTNNDIVQVQVALSPVKRPLQASQPRSPGRVLLGIDKGLTASDISLARAGGSTATSQSRTRNGSTTFPSAAQQPPAPSFSERMSAVRADDRARQATRDAASRARHTAFSLDEAEMERFRRAADKESSGRSSPLELREQTTYSRQDVLLAKTLADGKKSINGSTVLLHRRRSSSHTHSRPSSRGNPPPDATLQHHHHRSSSLSLSRPSSSGNPTGPVTVDAALYEPFSGLDLASRILPHSFLKRTLPPDEYKTYTIPDLLRDVTSPAFDLPDGVGNYVVFGIVAAKSSPRDHRQKVDEQTVGTTDWERKWDDGTNNTRKFIVITLTDLEWSLDLFLFGTAVPRYHRLSPGTVVAILNPTIMPPKKGKEDTGAFSLTLHTGEDTVLEIGQARNLGFCNAKRKDGKDCGSWINGTKTEVCEFHLAMQLHKTQSQRMGVNAGVTGFGGMGRGGRARPTKGGDAADRRLNAFTGPYYVSGAASGVVTDPGSQVPFMANVRESRDKKALLKKRMDDQAREEKIARQLGLVEHGNPGSQYLLHRTARPPTTDQNRGKRAESAATGSQRSAVTTRDYILTRPGGDPHRPRTVNLSRKRSAAAISSSPVKKTRFVTDAGIKLAGQESLGPADIGGNLALILPEPSNVIALP
ncbi:hypothetical protein DV735_g720, partial [Chaetothyriales sp. CBS 134920]